MLKLFQAKKKETSNVVKDKNNGKNTIDIDGVNINHFQSFFETGKVNEELNKVLKMALYVTNEFKGNMSTVGDLIELLHPSSHENRLIRLKFLQNQRKKILLDLKDMKEQIQNGNGMLKNEYRYLSKKCNEDIEASIQTLQHYIEAFKNKNTYEKASERFQPLYSYLDCAYKRKYGSSLLTIEDINTYVISK